MTRFATSGEYTCDACGETYEVPPGWDPNIEADAYMSPEEIATGGQVCDDCWQKMRAGIPDLARRLDEAGL